MPACLSRSVNKVAQTSSANAFGQNIWTSRINFRRRENRSLRADKNSGGACASFSSMLRFRPNVARKLRWKWSTLHWTSNRINWNRNIGSFHENGVAEPFSWHSSTNDIRCCSLRSFSFSSSSPAVGTGVSWLIWSKDPTCDKAKFDALSAESSTRAWSRSALAWVIWFFRNSFSCSSSLRSSWYSRSCKAIWVVKCWFMPLDVCCRTCWACDSWIHSAC